MLISEGYIGDWQRGLKVDLGLIIVLMGFLERYSLDPGNFMLVCLLEFLPIVL
jgi:hypothetical protein